MRIPSVFYGKYADVKKQVSKVVTKLVKKIPIQDSLTIFDIKELEPKPYEIVLDGPSPNNGGRMLFNLFSLTRLLHEKIDLTDENISYYFNDFNKTFWGHLCLSCRQHVYSYYKSEDIRVKYLISMYEFSNLYKENEQFFEVNENPWLGIHRKTKTVIDHPNHIAKYILGNLNYFNNIIPKEKINITLQENSFDELLQKYKIEEYIKNYF